MELKGTLEFQFFKLFTVHGVYCIYKLTHQIFTESDALLALISFYALQKMPECELPFVPLYLYTFPNLLTFSGRLHKDISLVSEIQPYKEHVCPCISKSSIIYSLIEKRIIICNLIITQLFFPSY